MGGGAGGGGFGKTKGGRASSKIHSDKQDKHVEGTKNFNQQIANGKHPSILTEDPTVLLREGAGKGRSAGGNKEVVDFGRVIGQFYDEETGRYYSTTKGVIHYDTYGNAHIVPARPVKF
ncbi:MAG: polymorphic toxin type 50 domain-containing protein [Firmicutes bacterium]|nr:polymorphic toxin type 50 domain-containing protein [Bacillota bacterium]